MAKLEFKGLDAILKKLDKFPDQIAKAIEKQGLKEAAEILKAEVEAQAPVGETGLLRSSVEVVPDRGKNGFVGMKVTIVGDGEGDPYYAAMNQFGTKEIPANPFMTRAIESKGEATKDKAIEAIGRLVDEELSK